MCACSRYLDGICGACCICTHTKADMHLLLGCWCVASFRVARSCLHCAGLSWQSGLLWQSCDHNTCAFASHRVADAAPRRPQGLARLQPDLSSCVRLSLAMSHAVLFNVGPALCRQYPREDSTVFCQCYTKGCTQQCMRGWPGWPTWTWLAHVHSSLAEWM